MANVLKPEKQEQVRALGRLGWSLRRIEEATGVRRETAGRYLREAGISVRGARRRRLEPPPEDLEATSPPTTDATAASEAASPPTTDSAALSEAASPQFAALAERASGFVLQPRARSTSPRTRES